MLPDRHRRGVTVNSVDVVIGNRLRSTREALGRDVGEFADQIGATPAMVEQWEAGTVRIPGAWIITCAESLGIHLGELMDGAGTMDRS